MGDECVYGAGCRVGVIMGIFVSKQGISTCMYTVLPWTGRVYGVYGCVGEHGRKHFLMYYRVGFMQEWQHLLTPVHLQWNLR